jgi:hypothetical protein
MRCNIIYRQNQFSKKELFSKYAHNYRTYVRFCVKINVRCT